MLFDPIRVGTAEVAEGADINRPPVVQVYEVGLELRLFKARPA